MTYATKTNEQFVVYFTEAVQKGSASPSTWMMRRSAAGIESTFDVAPLIVFDPNFPGKVKFGHKAFTSGAMYILKYADNTFTDVAGNCIGSSSASLPTGAKTEGYQVMFSSTIMTYLPTKSDTSNVTKYTNIAFTFTDQVTSWKPMAAKSASGSPDLKKL